MLAQQNSDANLPPASQSSAHTQKVPTHRQLLRLLASFAPAAAAAASEACAPGERHSSLYLCTVDAHTLDCRLFNALSAFMPLAKQHRQHTHTFISPQMSLFSSSFPSFRSTLAASFLIQVIFIFSNKRAKSFSFSLSFFSL